MKLTFLSLLACSAIACTVSGGGLGGTPSVLGEDDDAAGGLGGDSGGKGGSGAMGGGGIVLGGRGGEGGGGEAGTIGSPGGMAGGGEQTGGSDASGGVGGSGAGGAGGQPLEPIPYTFESGTQGWQDLKLKGSDIRASTQRAADGAASLQVSIDTRGERDENLTRYIGVPRSIVPKHLKLGQTLSVKVWLPAGHKLFAVHPFVVDTDGDWQGAFTLTGLLKENEWNLIQFKVTEPKLDTNKLEWIGVHLLTVGEGWAGTLFIDSLHVVD